MPSSFEDDPACDSLDIIDTHPLDGIEITEGPPPQAIVIDAWGPKEGERVVEAVRTLMQREFKIRIAVEDADTGALLWWVRPDVRARMGDTVHLDLPIRLEVN